MTTTEPVLGDALIPDVYASILGNYLEKCFEDYVGQTVEVIDKLPQPTANNGTIFIDFAYTDSDDFHIGSHAPLTQTHHGSILVMTKHMQEDKGRRHLRMLTTHLRRFLSYSENQLFPLLAQPVDQLSTGVERFMGFKIGTSELHPSLNIKSKNVQVSVTEFEITTETTCTWLNP